MHPGEMGAGTENVNFKPRLNRITQGSGMEGGGGGGRLNPAFETESFHSRGSADRLASVCLPVVGRGERRGPADLPPNGVGAQEDPRLARLLHLCDHRQHRHPLRPAEGHVTLIKEETWEQTSVSLLKLQHLLMELSGTSQMVRD